MHMYIPGPVGKVESVDEVALLLELSKHINVQCLSWYVYGLMYLLPF